MTYLDTLVRMLPRQQRVLDAQRTVGLGQILVGFILAGAVVVTDAATSWDAGPVFAMLLVSAGLLMLFGGYRTTSAEIRLAVVIAEQEALVEAIEERDRARRASLGSRDLISIEIHANSEQMAADIKRRLAYERKLGRHD